MLTQICRIYSLTQDTSGENVNNNNNKKRFYILQVFMQMGFHLIKFPYFLKPIFYLLNYFTLF